MGTFVAIVLSFLDIFSPLLDNSPTTEVAVGEFSLVVNLGPFVASGVFLDGIFDIKYEMATLELII